MKTIKPSNSEKLILVDDEDYDYLNQFKWFLNGVGYAFRNVIGKCCVILMSREILKLDSENKLCADHINHNPLDNQKVNLRPLTRSHNTQHRVKGTRKTTSKFKGVHLVKSSGKWRASIRIPRGKKKHIGDFILEIEAARAYNKKALEIFSNPLLNNV